VTDTCTCAPGPRTEHESSCVLSRVARWKKVLTVVYGGVPGGVLPESDADKLRAIADWLDAVDDAADVALDGRHTLDRAESLQESLRDIASRLTDPGGPGAA
jgi:hypothetical protein